MVVQASVIKTEIHHAKLRTNEVSTHSKSEIKVLTVVQVAQGSLLLSQAVAGQLKQLQVCAVLQHCTVIDECCCTVGRGVAKGRCRQHAQCIDKP